MAEGGFRTIDGYFAEPPGFDLDPLLMGSTLLRAALEAQRGQYLLNLFAGQWGMGGAHARR